MESLNVIECGIEWKIATISFAQFNKLGDRSQFDKDSFTCVYGEFKYVWKHFVKTTFVKKDKEKMG